MVEKHLDCDLVTKIQDGCHVQFVSHEHLYVYNFWLKRSKWVILVSSVGFSSMPNTVVPSQIIYDVV